MGRLYNQNGGTGRLYQQQPQDKEVGFTEKVSEPIRGLLTGLAKGAGSTAFGIGKLAAKANEKIGLGEMVPEALKKEKPEFLKPKTTAEKVGFGAEQIGEFLIPVGGGAKAANVAQKTGKLKSAGKLLVDMIKSGGEFAGKTALQTGGEEGIGTAGIIGAVSPVVGKVASGATKIATKALPERLYSQIFKTAQDDLMKYYKTLASGKEVNPTLAKELLDRGVMGNSKNMAVYSFKKLDDLESQVSKMVSDKKISGETIRVENIKGYKGLLETIKNQFKSGFFSERAKEAEGLINSISKEKSNLSMETTLKLRRFIDKMRNTSSFRLDPTLSARQEEYKVAADTLRKKLSDAGLSDLMNEERVFIEAIDNIVSDAARRQNNKLLNLTDYILGGGGLASGAAGAGIGAAAAVRAFQQPITLTGLAQGLYKTGKGIEKITPAISQIPKTLPPLLRDLK